MSLIANFLTLLNWNIRRRAHRHGGDDSSASTIAPAPGEPATERDEQIRQEWLNEHAKTGIEHLVVRAAAHDADRSERREPDHPPIRCQTVQLPDKQYLITDGRGNTIMSDRLVNVRRAR